MDAMRLVTTTDQVDAGLVELIKIWCLSAVSPELAIHKPLQRVVEDTITAACRSTHTSRLYARAIASFITLLSQENNLPELVDVVEIGAHKASAYSYGSTPAGVLLLVDAGLLDKFGKQNPANSLYAVRTFLSVALRDNCLTHDQAQSLAIKPYKSRTPRKRSEAGRILSVLEVQILRASIDTSTPLGQRDKAILDTMLFAGLRRSEVAGLKLSDFVTDKGRLHISLIGKGDKPRRVALHPDLFDTLSAWLEVYGHNFGDDRPAFVSFRKGGHPTETPLAGQNVGDLVADYGHRSGLASATGKSRLGAHDLRRTFSRRLYDQGAPLAAIQKLLGHESIETTMVYLKLDMQVVNGVIDLLNYD